MENYMGDYMTKYMNEWYIKYCRETGKYCDQIRVMHQHQHAESEEEQGHHQPHSFSPQHSHQHHSIPADHINTNQWPDNSYNNNQHHLQQQQHQTDNSNRLQNNIQDPIMTIWDEERYHNKQNQVDNHFFPNSAKSSQTQKAHNFHQTGAAHPPHPSSGFRHQEHNNDNNNPSQDGFDLFEPPRHKLLTRDKEGFNKNDK